MHLELTNADISEYIEILNEIIVSLKQSENNDHAKIVHEILEKLAQNQIDEFISKLNSVEMWGGSGAVWEVFIEDNKLQARFENAIIRLINLMERTQILGGGIKPIRRIFKKNQGII